MTDERATNSMKWASIPLLVDQMEDAINEGRYDKVHQLLFGDEYAVTLKYDGTNVCKDEYENVYGRTQFVIPDKKSW